LITGAAGFIGYHVANRFLAEGHQVVGLDSINDYYNPQLKLDRLASVGIDTNLGQWHDVIQSTTQPNYRFIRSKLEEKKELEELFEREQFDLVIHLAAQPGVRYSLKHPEAYVQSNIVGFLNILECCRHHDIKHLVYASSSSVYGNNVKMPLSTGDRVDHPVSLYAATKKSNELMAHSYSHLFDIPVTGLRFFTVYGPWARPDMATYLFADAIRRGKKLKIFNHGHLSRDFTYVDDIVEGVYRVAQKPPTNGVDGDGDKGSKAAYRIYNIGNSKPVKLIDFIETMEEVMGGEAEKEYLPMQPGDVKDTYADISNIQRDFGYQPTTDIKEGLKAFADWFKEYYG
jgi:UDP-glucuronate 4-epimerase